MKKTRQLADVQSQINIHTRIARLARLLVAAISDPSANRMLEKIAADHERNALALEAFAATQQRWH